MYIHVINEQSSDDWEFIYSVYIVSIFVKRHIFRMITVILMELIYDITYLPMIELICVRLFAETALCQGRSLDFWFGGGGELILAEV